MPTLNLKTKTIRYSKVDEDLLSACAGLADTIIEYDQDAADLAKRAFPLVDGLWQHVQRLRNGRGKASTPAAPKPAGK
jgi:hypothetical protein